jgi:hypothetical protein
MRIKAICEELSETQVSNSPGGAVSVAKTVAAAFDLEHVFCDPDVQERATLYAKHGTTEKIDKANGFPIREGFWLERISHLLPGTPMMFICGACHILTFGNLLRSRSLPVKVLHRDLAYQWKFGSGSV